MIWEVLGIEETKDEEAIRMAYRTKLRGVNPEDDEEGFKELRRAYEQALEYASSEETVQRNPEQEKEYQKHKNEVDLWIDRIDSIYQDITTRIDEQKWKEMLSDPICDDLDTEIEAAEKLLVYFMAHSFMPQPIWKLVDKRFHYLDDYEQLKEKFPENYLEYIKWQIENVHFLNFELFEGKTNAKPDEYINTLFALKRTVEDQSFSDAETLMKELKKFELTHPYAEVERAKYLLAKYGEEESEQVKEALSIMEELDFEYSDDLYVERIYAEALVQNQQVEKAKKIYEEILEKIPEHHGAMIGRANCIFLLGKEEEAKECIEDILEDRVQDADSLILLEKVNKTLVKRYEEQLEQEMDREILFKLGWCYYQQKEFEKGITLLDKIEASEDYDYINLRCRLYLASEHYEKAFPLTKKWVKLIEESVDDGSKEMTKRKNRLSLAHFSIGICKWELALKEHLQGEERESQLNNAEDYIWKAIKEENNILVMLSYMEQLARFFIAEKKYKKCIDICDEILAKDRGFFPAYVHRQKSNYELKNAKEVIDDYYACREIYPEYIQPYILAADVFMAFEQYDDVEEIIAAANELELKSDSMELCRIKCIHYKDFSEERVKEALSALLKLKEKIEQDTTSEKATDIEDLAEVEKELAIIYWDLEQPEKALEVIDTYLEGCPESTILLQLKMDILGKEREFNKALEICQKLIQLEPKDLYVRTKLGNTYECLGENEKALTCYLKILEENQNYVPAIRRLMYMYSYLSNRDRDLELCKKGVFYATRLIELTNAVEGYVERGNLYIDLYELEKAVEDCQMAIQLDADAYYAYNNLGCALLKLRRVDEAIKPLEKIIALEPDKDHLPYLNLAECYLLQKEYDKAIQAYEEVMRLRPEAMHLKEDIAKLYIKKEEYDQAIQIYQEEIVAVKKQIKNKGIGEKVDAIFKELPSKEEEDLLHKYCALAKAYRQSGDFAEADSYYKKVEAKYFNFLGKNYSCSIIVKVAEYYRDRGEIAKAEKIMKKGYLLWDTNSSEKDRAGYSFVYATILFEAGKQKQAEKHAKIFIQYLLKEHGGEEALLSDLRYRPMYLYDLGIMYICAGKLEKGKAYLEKIRACHLCVTCETCDCFEYYFGMGLLAELEGRKEEAGKLYQKAIEIKGDYPCAKRHLENL